ncbi:hypothetical protein FHW69_000949 [Luteibacter sp. Sphag1AF]|uniref:DUF1453 domain-containing protein n=1 Tax=Luteibacter sp. Sphag1AF TaxID=2587031 RepID=UPI00161ACCED|nr:DUF1453 domain-containing protein [Luteibacter sp. Sphag1AF]MBB3226359.1 hypothetical protein [Luteibacter sp. Sphag1AF]
MHFDFGTYAPFLFAPLIVLMLYRRLRSHFGQQPIRVRRMTTRLVIFSMIACAMLSSVLQDVRLGEGAAGGLILGAALGLVGLRFTRFGRNEAGDTYTPNPWIGGALSMLLIGRLIWRFAALAPVFAGAEHAAQVHGPAPGNSPLTMLVIGLNIGYYIAYLAGVLLRHRQHRLAASAA